MLSHASSRVAYEGQVLSRPSVSLPCFLQRFYDVYLHTKVGQADDRGSELYCIRSASGCTLYPRPGCVNALGSYEGGLPGQYTAVVGNKVMFINTRQRRNGVHTNPARRTHTGNAQSF